MARLGPGEMIPSFTLPSHGGEVRSGDYKQRRHLVLVFQPHECPICRPLLDALGVCYAEYRELNAQVIVVRRSEPPPELDEHLPFPVAWDDMGRVFDSFVGRDTAGRPLPTVFVADRFGEVAFVAEGPHGPEMASEVLARLEFLEQACPECNTVAWGWDQAAPERSGSEE